MSQTFHRSANWLSRFSLIALVLLIGLTLSLVMLFARTGYVTRQGEIRQQPIQFSHAHHAGGMGIDCRYCHTSVETSSFAGIPPTETCMTCHSQIWTESAMLEPVRTSLRENTPIRWNRVHSLPQYV